MRCLKICATVAAFSLLLGCLPERISEEELDQKINEALCGGDNAAADDNESCDDGNKKACDGCEQCGARRVLSVEGASDLLVVQTGDFETLKPTKADSFALSLWFKPKKKLVADKLSVLVGRREQGGERGFAIGLVGVNGGNGVAPACGIAANKGEGAWVMAYDYALKPDEWHHIVCGYNGDKKVIGVAADLNPLKEVNAKIAKGEGPIFADNDLIGLGFFKGDAAIGDNTVPYVGLIDEVRWSNEYPAKLPKFERRYENDLSSTVFLFHLDGPSSGAAYSVKNARGTLTAAALDITHKLNFANDNCYDTDGWALLCELSESPPDWCDDVQQ